MRIAIYFVLAVCFASCGTSQHDIKASKWLKSEKERQRVLLELVIHTDKLAPGASYLNRDSSAFIEYYTEKAKFQELANYYIKDTVCYFQIYKAPPSLLNERIAVAGRFKTDGRGHIAQIEEIYITPKLKPGELEEKSSELFINLIENDHVEAFKGNKQYVAFPDTLNHYDKQQQRWVFKHEEWFQ